MKKNKNVSGFTLFELLVSISIIGILTALASVAFSGAQKKARDARRMQDVRAIQTAAEQFYSQSPTYSYPTVGYTVGTVWVSGTGTTVLASYPIDPKGVEYSCSSCTLSSYCVCTDTEDDSKNANSGNNCDFSAVTKTHFCVKNQQ